MIKPTMARRKVAATESSSSDMVKVFANMVSATTAKKSVRPAGMAFIKTLFRK